MLNGHLYSYVMNNYWHTNYLAGQGGDFTFRFSITSRPKADNVASARFGWAVSNPLMAVVGQGEPQGPLPGQPDQPRLGRRAQRDRHRRSNWPTRAADLIVRLWELDGQSDHGPPAAGPAHPRGEGPGLQPGRGAAGPLEIRDGEIAVPIRASGLATVRVQ